MRGRDRREERERERGEEGGRERERERGEERGREREEESERGREIEEERKREREEEVGCCGEREGVIEKKGVVCGCVWDVGVFQVCMLIPSFFTSLLNQSTAATTARARPMPRAQS